MNPKTYRITNIIIKAIILSFVIAASFFTVHYSTAAINWVALQAVLKYSGLFWTILILLTGFCCGVVCMWLFYKPDSAWIVSRMDNPAAMAYIFTLMIIKIRVLRWKKYFKDINFNFIRGE